MTSFLRPFILAQQVRLAPDSAARRTKCTIPESQSSWLGRTRSMLAVGCARKGKRIDSPSSRGTLLGLVNS